MYLVELPAIETSEDQSALSPETIKDFFDLKMTKSCVAQPLELGMFFVHGSPFFKIELGTLPPPSLTYKYTAIISL